MPIVIKLQDIDEAIENLRYKNETTLKSRLLRAARQYYQDDESAESLSAIDTEDLVKTIWETGEDRELLKAKRKNFSSLKSSVNSDLKKLYTEGKNPQGIVIGHNNIFSISDEAKDKALAGIMDVFKEKGIDTQSKISEILSALSDILSTSISETDAENTKEEIDRLKNILGGISGKLGLSLQDIVRRAGAMGGPGMPISGPEATPADLPASGESLSGFIHGGLSMIDKGLQGLAREIEEASAEAAQAGVAASVRAALQDIVQALQDTGTDAAGKARKIMAVVEGILTQAVDASGNGPSAGQSGQIRQIFHDMAENTGTGPAAADQAGGRLLAEITSILGDGTLKTKDHPFGWQDKIGKIMAAVNDAISQTIAGGGPGLSDEETAGIKAMMASITGNLEALAEETLIGAESVDIEGSVKAATGMALEGLIQALRDTETDATGKAGKVMTALEGLLSDAVDGFGSGLSSEQRGQFKQIFHQMMGDADGELFTAVSAILGNGGLRATEKISMILSAANELIGKALTDGNPELSDEEIVGIKAMLANITHNLEGLAGMEFIEEIALPPEAIVLQPEEAVDSDTILKTAGVMDADASATSGNEEISEDVSAGSPDDEAILSKEGGSREISVKASMQTALQDMVQSLQDTTTDTDVKAKKIMAAVEGLLSDAISESGSDLSSDQAGALKQIFRGLTQSAGNGPATESGPAAGKMATPARIAGSELFAEVTSILDDGELSVKERISKIMAAMKDLIGEMIVHGDTELSDNDQASIREMLASITANLEALAGVEIVEEAIMPPEGMVLPPESVVDADAAPQSTGLADAGDSIGTDDFIEDTGASTTEGIKEIIENVSAGSPREALTSEESGNAEAGIKTPIGRALESIAQALGDSGTDTTGKAKKIMTVVEGLLSDAIDASGNSLSSDQAGQLKQIFHDMTQSAGNGPAAEGRPGTDNGATPASIAGGELLSKIAEVLGNGGLSTKEKLSKIMAAVNDLVGQAIAGECPGLSGEETAAIQAMIADITGNLETPAEETHTGTEGDDAAAGSKASIGAALEGMIQALRDAETDAPGKAGKVMAALGGLLSEVLDAAGSGLSSDQAAGLKQIFHQMMEDPDGELFAAVSSTLDDEELSTKEKLGKIMAALSVMIGETINDSDMGLSDDDQASIREMLANITANLEALAGMEIIEETIEEGDGESIELVEGINLPPEGVAEEGADTSIESIEDAGASVTDEIEEVIEDVSAGSPEVASASEEGGDASTGVKETMQAELQDILQTIRDEGTDVTGKAKKIMAAVVGLLSDAIDVSGSGLSSDQTGVLKQIFHEMLEDTGSELLTTVSAILGDGGLSAADHPSGWQDKLGKIVATLNDVIGETLGKADAGFSDEDQSRIREMLADFAGNLEALAGMEIVEEIASPGEAVLPPEGTVDGDAAGQRVGPADTGDHVGTDVSMNDTVASAADGTKEIREDVSAGLADETARSGEDGNGGTGLNASMQAALQDILQTIRDEGADVADKAKKIMAAVIGLLSDAIDASGSALSSDQTGGLKQIFHEMLEDTGGELLTTVSAILGDGELSATDDPSGWKDKISKFMKAASDIIGETIGESGVDLNDGDQARIREMLAMITANLEALAGIEIVEETIEDEGLLPEAAGAGQTGGEPAEISAGFPASPEETFTSGDTATDQAVSTASVEAEALEEAALPPEGVVLPPEEVVDAAAGAGAGESFEWVEDTIGGDALIAGTDSTAAEDGSAGLEEINGAATDGLEKISDGITTGAIQQQETTAQIAGTENFVEQDFVEEIMEAPDDEVSDVQVTPTDNNIDSDLREKTDLLTRLAEAAGVLQGLGPDLGGSVYTEEEIRGKAQFLSEEFDRYLSIRDKYYNAHILIKAGKYLVGGAHLAKSEMPEQIATLPDFYIGKFPVTNALFEIFVEQTGYVTTAEKYGYSLVYFPRMQRSRDPITGVERFALHNQSYSKKVPGACWHRPQGPDSSLHLKRTHPVVQVSLEDAGAFAVWTGKRLPSEIEWEAAARSAKGLLYPWGGDWQDDACNIEKSLHGDTTPVDQYAKFANAAGVADTLGNILEWTGDAIGDPETSDTYIVKGAGWVAHDEISLTDRHFIEKNTASNILGFRCVAI